MLIFYYITLKTLPYVLTFNAGLKSLTKRFPSTFPVIYYLH
jgi:hypothetical protein